MTDVNEIYKDTIRGKLKEILIRCNNVLYIQETEKDN